MQQPYRKIYLIFAHSHKKILVDHAKHHTLDVEWTPQRLSIQRSNFKRKIMNYLHATRDWAIRLLDESEGLFPRADLPIELSLLHGLEDGVEGRPRGVAESY